MTINPNNTTAACSGSERTGADWNADEWHLFLCQHLDKRATSPNGLNTAALKIADAMDAVRLTQASAPRSASAGKDGMKPIYIKRWRTLVYVSEAYADEIRDTMNAAPSPIRIDQDVGIRALEKIDALISNGDRPTVNERNAFEHFGKLNRLLLSIRDIARAAISVNTTAGVGRVTDEMVEAGARELWNDRDARHGGPWDSRDPREICVIQTKAAMRTDRVIGHDEAREIAGRLINSHFRKEPQARVGIPARPDYDDDLLISTYIEQQKEKDTRPPSQPGREEIADSLKRNGFTSRDGTYLQGGTFGVIDAILSLTKGTEPGAVTAREDVDADGLEEIIVDLRREKLRLIDALKPFAKISLMRDQPEAHSIDIDALDMPDFCITPDQVRDARRALSRNSTDE